MRRCTTIVLLAACLSSIVLAQTPASPNPAETPASTPQPSAQEPSPQQPSAEKTTSTEAPWDKFKVFSALMSGGPVPGTSTEIHIYRHGNLLRMEGTDEHSYIVQDLTKKADARMISRANCLQLKVPFVRSFPFSMSWAPNKYETVVLGKETIDGHPTQVEQVTITFAPEAKHEPFTLKIWAAEDLQGFPIKMETKSHRTIEYRNVDFGEQDPTLFIVPGECEPLDAVKDKKSTSQPKKAPGKAPSKQSH